MTDLLTDVTARSPRAVLADLALRATKAVARGRDRPEVALYLASGPIVTGRLVSVANDRDQPVALLHVSGPEGAPRVAAVRVDQVIAVCYDVVREAADAGPAPGRLEVQRAWLAQAAPIAQALAMPLELTLADLLDEPGRRAAATAAPMLGALLAQLATDALGREALLQLTTVRLGAARDGGRVRKDGTLLIVEVPSDPDHAWDAGQLRAEVEKAL